MPVGAQFRQLGRNIRDLGSNIKGISANINQGINDNIREIGRGITANIENLKLNVINMRNTDFANEAAFRSWTSHYDTTGIRTVRSMRKLFDIVEQRYPWVSIIFLLLNMTFETTAVVIFLICAHETTLEGWVSFQWTLGYFITEVVLSIFFLISWSVLLSSSASKVSYLFRITSIMTYLSAGWMVVLGFLAAVTRSRSWTHTYAPMFFRIWWLHECVLALLDYPQISAFFTENRIEMARSMIQCFAVMGISVGILQVVESFDGDPMGYFDVFYMMILTFSTVGYGDISPKTTKGYLVLIVCIGVGLNYFVPLLEYVAELGKLHLLYKYYRTWFKRTQHVVLCGDFNYDTLRIQLRNIFGGKRFYLNIQVVVMLAQQPSADILLLLNAPKYRGGVTVLVGDPANTKDLDRCNARGSSAIFLLGKGVTSLYYSDYTTADQAVTVASHVPRVPLHVLLHRSRYTRSIIPKSAKVVECERLCHCLLGLGCVLPGMVPVVGNLIRVFDPMVAVNLWKSADFADAKSGALAVAKTLTSLNARQRDIFSYDTLYAAHSTSATTATRGGGNRSGSGADGPVIINDADAPAGTGGTAAEAAEEEEGTLFEPPWKHLYEASLAQHVEVLPLPTSQRERSFRSLAAEMYKVGVTVIGVVRDKMYPVEGGGRLSPSGAGPLSPSTPSMAFRSPTAQQQQQPATPHSPATPFVYANESVVELAPRGDLYGVERLVVICDKRSRALQALNGLSPLANDDYESRRGFDDAQSRAALREYVEAHHHTLRSPTSRRSMRFSCASIQDMAAATQATSSTLLPQHRPAESVVSVASEQIPSTGLSPTDASPGVAEGLGGALTRVATTTSSCGDGGAATADVAITAPRLGSLAQIDAKAVNSFTARTLRSASFAKPSTEKLEPIRMIERADHLHDHFVFIDLSRAQEREQWSAEASKEAETAKAADYFDTMRPARQHSPLSQIVLLAGEDNYNFLGMMWEEEMTGCLHVVNGCGLFLEDLKRCHLEAAAAVVIFSAGDRCDRHSDTLAVLVARTVKQIIANERLERGESPQSARDVPLVVEFDTTDYMALTADGTDESAGEEKQSKQDFALEPHYTAGTAVYRHMLDTSLQESYFLPELQQVLDQLLTGHQDTLLVTSMEMQTGWRVYEDLVTYALSRRMLPLAIHRMHEEPGWSFRFPITNPPPPFPLRPDDIVYCLKVK